MAMTSPRSTVAVLSATIWLALAAPAHTIELPSGTDDATVRIAAVPGLTPELDTLYQEVLDLLLDGEKDEAVHAAEALLTAFRRAYGGDSTLLATPSLYLGLLQLDVGETFAALSHLDRAVRLIEREHGRFDLRLIAPLRGLAIAHIETGRRESAVASLRRAQHLTHRHMGVYNTDQLPILDLLLTVDTGRIGMIDTLSTFNLKVHEEAFGENDPRIVPALLRMAEYMANKGKRTSNQSNMAFRSKFFRDSLGHSARAIQILEDAYGENDPRIIEVLRIVAETKLKRGLGKGDAVAAIKRARDIVIANAGSDVSDIAYAKVELADVYTLWDDHRATGAYRDAWNSIPDDPRYDALRHELFGAPRQISSDDFTMALRERPWRTGRVNFLEMEYVVRADGRARRFETLESNVPLRARDRMRAKLRRARFRPRMEDGDVVETGDMVVRREFALF